MKNASLSFLVWVNDHQQSNLPFRTPFWDGGTQVPSEQTSWPDGVTSPHWLGLQNQAWFQFAWISNELESPRILVCPADKEKKAASCFGGNSQGGFNHRNNQNHSLSYALWLDAGINGGVYSYENSQEHILLSDRHMSYDRPASICSSGYTPVREVLRNTTVAGWESRAKFGHVPTGNIALLDGSVASVTTLQVRELFPRADDNGAVHYMNP